MIAATVWAPKPSKQWGRTALTVQPLELLSSSNDNDDTAAALRLQRLLVLGIVGKRADMLAVMVWGEMDHA